MKKSLVYLLTFIFAFSSVSILGVGTASAEEQATGQEIIKSDFDDSDGTNWYVSHNNVVFGEENGDDYARVTISNEAKGSGLASPSFNLVTGNEYELTYYMRIPEGSSSYMIGTTYYAPTVSLYMPKVTESGVKVTNIAQSSTAENSNNFYAYSYNDKTDSSKSWARRNTFPMEIKVDGYNARTKNGSSGFAWSEQSSYFGGKVVNEVFAEWTKVTAKFTAVASTDGEKSQITALSFSFLDYKASGSLIFDVKNVSLVCTKSVEDANKNTLVESDFKADYEKGSTNWVSTLSTSNHVEIKNEADEYFARVSNGGKSHGGMFTTPFEVTPNNDYELSFYFRIPAQTREGGYNFGVNYQPAFGLFEVATNADKTAVAPTKNLVVTNNTSNTLYAFNGSNSPRRTTFESNWTIELPGNTVEFSRTGASTINYTGPNEYKNIVSEKDATEVYTDWTKFTVKFKGVADESGETSQTAAFAFNFLDVGNSEIFFDIKDVKLMEKVNVVTPEEPEQPEGTVIPEGYTDYEMKYLKGMYKTQGRTSVKNDILLIDYTASGIEFSANCEGDVYVTFNTSKVTGTDEGGCYFTVIVDGVKQPRDFCRITNTGDTIFAIAKELPKGVHTFEIYRQTEIERAEIGIKSIALKSGSVFELAPANKDLYIEFIGDSLSTAYGNLTYKTDIQNGTYKYSEAPLHQDGTMGFPYLTARTIGADWSVVAQQGRGAKYGFTKESLYDIYPKLRYNRDKNTNYDFAREPDIVVIGCGTNDTRTYNKEQYTNPVATLDDVKQGYKELLALVREKNPNAKIVWIHNMIDDEPSWMVPDVMEEAGGEFAGYYVVEVIRDTEVLGTNGHPYYTYHEALAEDLASKLADILEQNDFATGDLNGDGKLNLYDLVVLSQFNAKWEGLGTIKKLAADINGDKKSDLDDITHFAQHLAGWENVKLGAELDYTRGIKGVVDKTLATYTSETGLKMQYTLLTPKNYDEAKEYPVLLFLHGADAKGIGNERPIQKLEPFYDTDAKTMSEAIVLIPQCPDSSNKEQVGKYSDYWWNFKADCKGALNIAMELLEKVVLNKYNCDENRFYVMGLSMGGQGTWKVTEKYANKVAAAIPICGGNPNPEKYSGMDRGLEDATKMVNVPIRMYHSKDDDTVLFSESEKRYNALIEAGAKKVTFIELEGYGHNAWEYVDKDAEGIKWLFEQNLQNR